MIAIWAVVPLGTGHWLFNKWTVVMNNDVICAKGWLRYLLASAETHHLQPPALQWWRGTG
jgi:hypothetical protein